MYVGVPVPSYETIYSFYMGGCKNNSATPANCDLPLWLAVQSAILCVNSKLRTPLGKAQDTFIAIEGEEIENVFFTKFVINFIACNRRHQICGWSPFWSGKRYGTELGSAKPSASFAIVL